MVIVARSKDCQIDLYPNLVDLLLFNYFFYRQMEFTASFTTEVFFLQNDAGAKKWPVTGDVVESLRQAFCD